MPQDLPRDAVLAHAELVDRHRTVLADFDDTGAEAARKLLREVPRDGLLGVQEDERVQAVRRGRDGAPLRVLLPDAFYRVQLHVDLLPRAQFGEDDVFVRRSRRCAYEDVRLFALWNPDEVPAFYFVVDVFFAAAFWGAFAGDLQTEDERVAVVWCGVGASRCAEVEEGGVSVEWYESDAVCKHFVVDNRCVVPNVDVLYSDCWNLSYTQTSW